MRRLLGRSIAVSNPIGVASPIRVFAMAILALMTPLAFAAHHIMFNEDKIARLETFATGELAPCLGDIADVLMSHDCGSVTRRSLIELYVRAADAGNFHLQERGVLRNIRHWELAKLGPAGSGSYRRQNCLCHVSSSLGIV